MPERSVGTANVLLTGQAWPARLRYAAVVASCARAASPPGPRIVPSFKVPGGKPVTDVPGSTPRSPVMIVGPVLVTVAAPSTAKASAAPSAGAICADAV